jgi:MoaA/NifB/PqqE/SkfB family radical SAM enzyme
MSLKNVFRKKMNSILYISLGQACNNNCLGCAVRSQDQSIKQRDINSVKKDILTGKKEGYKNLHLIGGEITVYNHIIDILEFSKKLFDNIIITTNGRRFAYPLFSEKICPYLNQINITLQGHTAELHDFWTQKKGSFDQTIKGIQNISKYLPKQNIGINHIIYIKTYNKTKKVIRLALNLGITNICLVGLEPMGKAKNIYTNLYVPLLKMANFDKNFIHLIPKLNSLDIEDIPKCVFSNKLKNFNNIHIQDISSCIYLNSDNKISTYGLFAANDAGLSITSNTIHNQNLDKLISAVKNYRKKLKPCLSCLEYKTCAGLFTKYINIYGKTQTIKQLQYLKKIHNL